MKEEGNIDFHTWLMGKLIGSETKTFGEKIGSIFTLSALIAMLSVIPAFLLLRILTNNFIALIGSLLLVSIGTFVSRTVAGFVDTDAYNVFFPLAIVALIVYALKSKNKLTLGILSIMAGLFMGLFSWAWSSSWFLFVFILVALGGYLGFILISLFFEKKSFKEIGIKSTNDILTVGLFVLFSSLFAFLFTGGNLILNSFKNIFSVSSGNIASISQSNIWPNVYSSVAELNPASFAQILDGVGGTICIYFSFNWFIINVFRFHSP